MATSVALRTALSAILLLALGSVSARTQSGIIPFPPRDEAYDFRVNHLETKYRDGLRRSPVQTFVNVEGEIVWTQEYLRHRVNGASHTAAVDAVRGEIDRVSGFPGLLNYPSFALVAFPPRNESFSFRTELERIYRDRLGRGAVSTFVDNEGALVWTQQYLLHRVNGCGHLEAALKVLDEIDGRTVTACVAPPLPCTFAISSFAQTYPASGGSGSFTVTTQAGCTWYAERAVSSEDYVSLGEQIRNGTQTVTYTVRANTTGAARSGQVYVRESPTNRLLYSHTVNQS
jgi:hypothetical protein